MHSIIHCNNRDKHIKQFLIIVKELVLKNKIITRKILIFRQDKKVEKDLKKAISCAECII